MSNQTPEEYAFPPTCGSVYHQTKSGFCPFCEQATRVEVVHSQKPASKSWWALARVLDDLPSGERETDELIDEVVARVMGRVGAYAPSAPVEAGEVPVDLRLALTKARIAIDSTLRTAARPDFAEVGVDVEVLTEASEAVHAALAVTPPVDETPSPDSAGVDERRCVTCDHEPHGDDDGCGATISADAGVYTLCGCRTFTRAEDAPPLHEVRCETCGEELTASSSEYWIEAQWVHQDGRNPHQPVLPEDWRERGRAWSRRWFGEDAPPPETAVCERCNNTRLVLDEITPMGTKTFRTCPTCRLELRTSPEWVRVGEMESGWLHDPVVARYERAVNDDGGWQAHILPVTLEAAIARAAIEEFKNASQ